MSIRQYLPIFAAFSPEIEKSPQKVEKYAKKFEKNGILPLFWVDFMLGDSYIGVCFKNTLRLRQTAPGAVKSKIN
ncbi:hypothetical protein [Leptolyngbya sp. 7M]|uniref:hypothetical protein n=1 Tax=Leptolyngbya sp. 7M TaxID=2812896 RepID=UPI001B8D7333|nr:hypothetical protein [Leptolyngbya sp. 7M]QYO65590.1 hypothetical protein JVX88_02030 [Leptolyngbya sp. 7M]